MKIKAQGFLNAVDYVERKYGRDKLASVLQECSATVREHHATLIAIDWQEMSELCEFIETAERVLNTGAGELAEATGETGAKIHTKGMLLKAAFYLGRPQYLMRRIAGMWSQFNDEGSMAVLELTEQHVRIELKGITDPRTAFCSVLTGWCREIARALGVKEGKVAHTQCRARGGKHCIWEIRGRVAGA